jgi:hypothetical protein
MPSSDRPGKRFGPGVSYDTDRFTRVEGMRAERREWPDGPIRGGTPKGRKETSKRRRLGVP